MRGIDPFLLSKINSQNQTIYNNANPKVSVQVSRAKTTVSDSTYWTVETIRERPGLGDLSIAARRQKAYGPPNRLYNIYIENNVVRTAIREYPDYLKEKWKDQFDLGPGSAVAIAFDGEWEWYRKKWQLKTYENPFIFWVDGSGKLWVQLWNDVTTKLELAVGVSKVKSIRGWKNTEVPEVDQGLIVGYIKVDGKAYYRNYCYQPTGEFYWEYEKEIAALPGPLVNLNMFRTNDYKVGFIVEDLNGALSWAITSRSWAGMANPPESITAGITDIAIVVYPIIYHDLNHDEYLTTGITDLFLNVAEPIYPVVIGAMNDDDYTMRIKFSHAINYDLTLVKAAFNVKDTLNVNYGILSTAAGIDNTEIVLNMVNFASAKNNMFITYDRNIVALDSLYQGSLFAIDSFVFEFKADIEPPQGHAIEHLSIGINPTLTVLDVTYTSLFTVENLNVGISNIAIVVTKVGENPL